MDTIKIGPRKKAKIIIEDEDGSTREFYIRKPLVSEQEEFSEKFEQASGVKEQNDLTREFLSSLGLDMEFLKTLDIDQASQIMEGVTGFLKKK